MLACSFVWVHCCPSKVRALLCLVEDLIIHKIIKIKIRYCLGMETCCSYKKTLLYNVEYYVAWQTRRPFQVSKILCSLCCFSFLKHVGAACLYLGGHIFGETGLGPLRSVESHPLVLIGSKKGPRGTSYNSMMLPRSFICILSCPLFPIICFPS